MKIDITYLNKFVGIYNEATRTYISHRKIQHYFRKFDGYGMSYGTIRKLIDMGCLYVVILFHTNKDKIIKYKTTIKTFLENGEVYIDKENDCQRILPKIYFNKE